MKTNLRYQNSPEAYHSDVQYIKADFTYNVNAMARYDVQRPVHVVLEQAKALNVPVVFSSVRASQWFTNAEGYQKLRTAFNK